METIEVRQVTGIAVKSSPYKSSMSVQPPESSLGHGEPAPTYSLLKRKVL